MAEARVGGLDRPSLGNPTLDGVDASFLQSSTRSVISSGLAATRLVVCTRAWSWIAAGVDEPGSADATSFGHSRGSLRHAPGFAVHVAESKYLDRLPLERQVKAMGRRGLFVPDRSSFEDRLHECVAGSA